MADKEPDNHDEKKPAKRGTAWALGAVAGALGLIAAGFVVALLVAYGGLYNVAATEQHTAFGRWALDTTFHSSVRRQSAGLSPPAELTPAQMRAGASAYKSMCEHCHAGPGAQRADWASGMRPRPPHLAEEAAEWELAEVFWIAKHGVRMTGMPAFGPTHTDAELWGVAGFVKSLPGMDAATYAASGSAHEHSHGAGGS